jgi:UDP:flavonoid glycosyltransferase YjiC (YdhE family)
VVENITLTQVTRLVTLASSLNNGIEIHFASSDFNPIIFHSTRFRCWKITSISKQQVLEILKKGQSIYSTSILQEYISEELDIMKQIKPDVVVGNFRLSLSISTALVGIPFINLINAYWSPYAVRSSFPVPDHPIVKIIGNKIASRFFPLVKPWFFNILLLP